MAKTEKPAAPDGHGGRPATAEKLLEQPAASTTATQKPAPSEELLPTAPATGEQLLEQSSAPAAEEPSTTVAAGPVLTELDDAIPGLWIRSVPPTFRRCGFAFTREGIGIALSALDEDQVEVLVNEPNLVVEHTVFTEKVQD